MSARSVLDVIRQRADNATDGPWAFEPDAVSDNGSEYRPARVWTDGGVGPWGDANDDYVLGVGIVPEDAEFIAAARTDVPRLLAALTAALDLADDKQRHMLAPGYVDRDDLIAAIEAALTEEES